VGAQFGNSGGIGVLPIVEVKFLAARTELPAICGYSATAVSLDLARGRGNLCWRMRVAIQQSHPQSRKELLGCCTAHQRDCYSQTSNPGKRQAVP